MHCKIWKHSYFKSTPLTILSSKKITVDPLKLFALDFNRSFNDGLCLTERHRNDPTKIDHAGFEIGRGGIFAKMIAGSLLSLLILSSS